MRLFGFRIYLILLEGKYTEGGKFVRCSDSTTSYHCQIAEKKEILHTAKHVVRNHDLYNVVVVRIVRTRTY